MIRTALFALPLVLSACTSADASVSVLEIGKAAPTFALPNLDNTMIDTASFADQTLVVEWFNPDCPFVKYAYGDGELGALSQKWTAEEVVWIRVNSGAPGKQGTELDRNRQAQTEWGLGEVLLDPEGKVGKLYGATTTPHIYIIDKGTLAYMGGLDNAPMGKVKGDAKLPYVDQALASVKEGKPVQTAVSKQYGCSVKY